MHSAVVKTYTCSFFIQLAPGLELWVLAWIDIIEKVQKEVKKEKSKELDCTRRPSLNISWAIQLTQLSAESGITYASLHHTAQNVNHARITTSHNTERGITYASLRHITQSVESRTHHITERRITYASLRHITQSVESRTHHCAT